MVSREEYWDRVEQLREEYGWNVKGYNVDNYNSTMNLDEREWVDWHSKNTITFGSLIDDGWDWGRNDWSCWTASEETINAIRTRINNRIEEEYYFLEIGVLPPGRFKINLRSKINEIMEELGPIYEEIYKGLDIRDSSRSKYKGRDIRSEYPQAQLMTEEEDYASWSLTQGNERRDLDGQVDSLIRFQREFKGPDGVLLKHIRVCFSNLITFNI